LKSNQPKAGHLVYFTSFYISWITRRWPSDELPLRIFQFPAASRPSI